jgi:hypothetical protein
MVNMAEGNRVICTDVVVHPRHDHNVRSGSVTAAMLTNRIFVTSKPIQLAAQEVLEKQVELTR